MEKFYDGTKLLSLKDINGNTPEIFICTTNRSAGKTTYFNRLAINKFKKKKSKFCLVYRYNYELDDCADKFFKDINTLFFPNDIMISKRKASGIYHVLYLNEEECGFAISLNSAEQIKKYSHLFSDVECMIFDEFQSETNRYCPDEVKKLISVHQSISRGQGKHTRYVPIYMIGNPVTMLNPYYIALGITKRLDDKTKFLKGNGFVMEQGYNESASKAQLGSAFNQAFSNNEYIAYSTQNVYLNDNKSFIEKPSGKSYYLCTIKYNSSLYGIREYLDDGIIYCDDKYDESYPIRFTVSPQDHQKNFVLLSRYDFMLTQLKDYFNQGSVRFKNLECKNAFLEIIS